MSELLSFYQQQALNGLSDDSQIKKLQEQGLASWMDLGLPKRIDESWKYSPPLEFAKHNFKCVTPSPAIMNLPANCFCLPLEQALKHHQDLVGPYVSHLMLAENGFEAFNTAMLHNCHVIYLRGQAPNSQPLTLHHDACAPETLQVSRYLVILEENANWSLLDIFTSKHDQLYARQHVNQIFLRAGAQFTYAQVQQENLSGLHWSHTRVSQEARSNFISHSLHVGGNWVRADQTIEMLGEQSECKLNGIYAINGKQHLDHHTAILHQVSNCKSEQNYKGLMDGQSCGVFNGRVWVAPNAQKTEARQYNKNLLLSAAAQINAKPQLEIYANDVVCAHGATVGQLDQDALFYLASRGINAIDAQQFLKDAFTAENFACIQDPELRAQLFAVFRRQQGASNVANP